MSEQVTDETVIGISSCFNGHRPIVVGDSIRLNDIDEPYRQRLLEYDNVVAERDDLGRKLKEAMELLEVYVKMGSSEQCDVDDFAELEQADNRYEALKKGV